MKALILIVTILTSLNSFAKIKGLSGGSDSFIRNSENTEILLNNSELDEQCADAIEEASDSNFQVDFKKLEELNCKLELKKSN